MIKKIKKIKNKVLIVAGGSGGHVFPGLSVAHYLIDQGYQVMWLGTSDHIEAFLVPKHGIDIKFIYIKGWRGKVIYKKLIVLFFFIFSTYQSLKIIKYWKPDVVLGMGGYVSAPVGLAAWILRIPLIIHEQNRVVGLTNRFLSILANQVLQGFPGVFKKAKMVGNPICHTILSLPNPVERWKKRTGPIRVLVIGGSKGASIFNKIIPDIAEKLMYKAIIWHQVGEKNLQDVLLNYYKFKKNNYRIVSFINDIAQAYAWADILIARAGALTVSEVAVVGLPAIFVPFTCHKDYQQYWNALPLLKFGAAKIIEEHEFTSNNIKETLESWDRVILLDMAQRAKALAIPNATQLIVQIIIQYLKK